MMSDLERKIIIPSKEEIKFKPESIPKMANGEWKFITVVSNEKSDLTIA